MFAIESGVRLTGKADVSPPWFSGMFALPTSVQRSPAAGDGDGGRQSGVPLGVLVGVLVLAPGVGVAAGGTTTVGPSMRKM